jgi:BioD-like phosphotransacetylase family protein
MNRIIVGSVGKSAGKTSLIVGIGKNLEKKIGYLKPFGERILYRKKRLWDYDSALVASLFDLKERPEDMSIGFEHSKLRYMYDEKATREKLLASVTGAEKDSEVVFIEGGSSLWYGASVHLDPLTIAKHTGGKLVVVVSGQGASVMDDIVLIKKYIQMEGINFAGIVVNKVPDIENFKEVYQHEIEELGVNLIGVVPHMPELTTFSAEYLVDYLFAKIICGEHALTNKIENIFVGAMSGDAALRNSLFAKKNKLIITSGDRTDMIIAALESDTSCVVLTNGIMPQPNIISKASHRNIPLLLVNADTYQVAKQIDTMDPLLTRNAQEKIELLKQNIKKYVRINDILA